jgi:hypothetical protein
MFNLLAAKIGTLSAILIAFAERTGPDFTIRAVAKMWTIGAASHTVNVLGFKISSVLCGPFFSCLGF